MTTLGIDAGIRETVRYWLATGDLSAASLEQLRQLRILITNKLLIPHKLHVISLCMDRKYRCINSERHQDSCNRLSETLPKSQSPESPDKYFHFQLDLNLKEIAQDIQLVNNQVYVIYYPSFEHEFSAEHIERILPEIKAATFACENKNKKVSRKNGSH